MVFTSLCVSPIVSASSFCWHVMQQLDQRLSLHITQCLVRNFSLDLCYRVSQSMKWCIRFHIGSGSVARATHHPVCRQVCPRLTMVSCKRCLLHRPMCRQFSWAPFLLACRPARLAVTRPPLRPVFTIAQYVGTMYLASCVTNCVTLHLFLACYAAL